MKTALLFDLDGTLCETIEDIAGAANAAMRGVGAPERSVEDVIRFVGRGVDHLLRQCLGEGRPEGLPDARRIFMEHYRAHFADRTYLYPDVAPALERLKHLPMGVLSNKPTELCRVILSKLGIASYFRVILGEDAVPRAKPDPEAAFAALEALGLSRERASVCWMIGDTEIDFETGRRAGMKSALLRRGYGSFELIRAIGEPELWLEDLSEFAP